MGVCEAKHGKGGQVPLKLLNFLIVVSMGDGLTCLVTEREEALVGVPNPNTRNLRVFNITCNYSRGSS